MINDEIVIIDEIEDNDKLTRNQILCVLSNVKNFLKLDNETKQLILSFKAILLNDEDAKIVKIFNKYKQIHRVTKYGEFDLPLKTEFDVSFDSQMPDVLKTEIIKKGKRAVEEINAERQDGFEM